MGQYIGLEKSYYEIKSDFSNRRFNFRWRIKVKGGGGRFLSRLTIWTTNVRDNCNSYKKAVCKINACANFGNS